MGNPMNAWDGTCPREILENGEEGLSEYAARSRGANETRAHSIVPDPFRTEFERDYTRIIHCRAFRRLRHKTQVFLSPENDHICTRLEHSLYVASISRTLARALNLNENLVLAIAAGHDLGHAPFGHIGESILHGLAEKHGLGRFWHEEHSLRIVDSLEKFKEYHHQGLNLTLAVRDGIACHYGESFPAELAPDRSKGPDYILKERKKDRPRSLEGCVVRCVDVIAYLGRDLEDGMRVNLVKEDAIPADVRQLLGTSNRSIIDRLIGDIYANAVQDGFPDRIRFSEDMIHAGNCLKEFNYKRIYETDFVRRRQAVLTKAIGILFDELVALVGSCRDDLAGLPRQKSPFSTQVSQVLLEFLRDDLGLTTVESDAKEKEYVLYFIAGMTDNFFLRVFTEMFQGEV